MIQNIVTMDRDDIINILADLFRTERNKVKLYFVETVIEDDIRAEIELTSIDGNEILKRIDAIRGEGRERLRQ